MTGNNSLDLIPVRMLTQFAYCNRLSYMEWVQGEFAENLKVAKGRYHHRNVDTPQGRTKDDDDDDGKETIHTKSVFLSGISLGLTAKLDILEVTGTRAIPVQYKRGKRCVINQALTMTENTSSPDKLGTHGTKKSSSLKERVFRLPDTPRKAHEDHMTETPRA